jgi:aspartyl/asparaginyl beta-hydroxylase (cupin superfamily)
MKYFFEDQIKNMKICVDLVNNYEQIKKEILAFIAQPNALNDYPQYKVENNKNIYENYWKAAPLSVFKEEHVELNGDEQLQARLKVLIEYARKQCPTITSIIKDLEEQGNLANSFISRLIPGSIINPHVGWSENWLRVHLGIVTDPNCKITVGNETRAWEDGKLLAFIDGPPVPHSVRHDGTKERIILSVDLKREYVRNILGK